VPVTGLQKPTQHSASTAHVAEAALHEGPRHSPALQVPSQQSLAVLHGAPITPHAGSRHRFWAQLEPMQQSLASTQPWPGLPQRPLPAQRLARQLREQHTAALEHPSPSAPQPQEPLRQAPSQQSVWNRQLSPAGLQGNRHSPSTQEPWQHSRSSPQLSRSAVHCGGGGGVVGLQAITRIEARVSSRSRMRAT
jgi:hypothetical protein